MLTALVLSATVALTPSLALAHARAMVNYALGSDGAAHFRSVELRALGPDMVFCGQVNTRDADGRLSGWREVMIVVSGNPGGRAVLTGDAGYKRDIIRAGCRHGVRVDRRNYAAVLSVP
jgi:hypothetical protein